VSSFADPDFRRQVVHHSFMETSMWPRVNYRRLGSFSLKTNPKGRGQKAQEMAR
jgi:hypothetical protein